MSLSYAHEKFSLAIDGMATSPASIQLRIADAYISQLIRLNEQDLPEDIRTDFRLMREQLTSRSPEGDEGSVMATVNKMSEEEATAIARKISRMHDTIAAAVMAETD